MDLAVFTAHTGPLLAVLAASFLQAITGFGLVMVAAPLLMFFYDPRLVVLLVVLLASCGNSTQTLILRRDARWDIVRRMFFGSLCAQPVGYAIYHNFPSEGIKLLVSVVILISLTAMQLSHWRFHQTPRGDVIAGFIAGAMATTTGMAGPVLILYFAAAGMTPATLRATTIAFFFCCNVLSVTTFLVGDAPMAMALNEVVILLPALVLGIALGHTFFRYLPAARFRQLLNVILYIVCLYTIGSVWLR